MTRDKDIEDITYDYVDEEGKLLYQAIRQKDKRFSMRRPDGKGGWINDMDGVRRVPYNLPAVMEKMFIVIVEGEKDADNLNALFGGKGSWVATTIIGGSNGWKEEYADFFLRIGTFTFVIPDRDKQGQKLANDIVSSLDERSPVLVYDLKVYKIRDKHGKDISDWMERLKSKGINNSKIFKRLKNKLMKESYYKEPEKASSASQFDTPIYSSKPVKLTLTTLADIYSAESPRYLIEDILVENGITLLTGYSGVCKSLLSLFIAKSIITKNKLFNKFEVNDSGSVLIIDEENAAFLLKDRCQKLGLKVGHSIEFFLLNNIKMDSPDYFEALLEFIKKREPRLIIFDSLIRLHSANENSNSEMAFVMSRFKELAKEIDTTIIILHHDRKGSGDGKYRARGSGDIVAAVDFQICLEKVDEDTLKLSQGKSRMSHFSTILLSKTSDAKSITLEYIEEFMSNSEVALESVIDVLGSGSLSFNEIKEKLDSREVDIGINKLRDILKNAVGDTLEVVTEARGKKVYKLKKGEDAV